MLLRITPSGAERIALAFNTQTLEEAASAMRSDGALVIESIIDKALVVEAREAFARRYDRFLKRTEHDDALEVGDKRVMVTIDFEPPFDRIELFANSWVLSVLKAAFEDDFVLGGYGVVCSLPGAKMQHRHRDGGILFPQSGLDRMLPVSAVTALIPLLEMNDVNGTTELWLGSHRDSDHFAPPTASETRESPVVEEGSCVIWDFRLVHCGTPNKGTQPRPLLYLTYCRPWFLDYLNNRKQPLLRASKQWLSTLAGESRGLLDRAMTHWLPETTS
jgi:ectoine hydroxylase-related dioxygenase (phytanoyl-CoA dioxygenase family)